MEDLGQLADFYEAIADDVRIGDTHICLYMALVHERNVSSLDNPVYIKRGTLMKNARISRKTYNKRMNELQEYGYIKYEPSSNPFISSKVYLNKL